jgi:hypothetical protein
MRSTGRLMRLGFRRSEGDLRFVRKHAEALETPDDRGRVVRLFMPESLGLLRGAPAGFEAAEFRRIRWRVVGRDTAYGGAMAMMALLAIWLSVTLIYRVVIALATGDGWFDAAKTGVWLVGVGIAAELMFRGYGRPGKDGEGWRRRVRAAILAEHRCPSCSYPLGELAAEGDGCTVCPECGAAWRVGGS